MRVTAVAEGEDAARWDAYVGARTSTVTDLAAWRRVVRQAYGLRDHFLAALDGDRMVGALGLYEIDHPVFGHYLTTAVFATDGGFQFEDATARDALLQAAKDLTARRGAAYLQIRTRSAAFDGFRVDHHYRTAVLDLSGGAEAVWKRLPSKTRNQVRRGTKEGFSLATGHREMGAFFDVFHQHMRELGSPAHGWKFYESILEHLGEQTDFLVVREGETLVAGAMLFQWNGTGMNLQTVSLRPWNRRCPNYFLYWKMIEASCAAGSRWLDMGRSEAGGANIAFKSNWGAHEIALQYNYFLLGAKDVPYLDPHNPKYRLAIRAWQKLPLFVTRRLGRHLITGLA